MYLHSPFIFELYENTIGEKKHGMKEDFPQLFQNSPFLKPTQIERSNYGAVKKSESVSINKLVNSVSISKKYGEWIYNMVRFYNPNCVLETGTCLGIGTAYLASGKPSANVYSIDAHKPYLELASTFHAQLGLKNIRLLEADVIEGIANLLSQGVYPDFVYIDANHTYESVLEQLALLNENVHSKCIWVIDDIRWSEGMFQAWEFIRTQTKVRVSVDLGRMGVLFFNEDIHEKQHFMIRF